MLASLGSRSPAESEIDLAIAFPRLVAIKPQSRLNGFSFGGSSKIQHSGLQYSLLARANAGAGYARSLRRAPDPPTLFDLIEKPIDQVARTVELRAEADQIVTITSRRNGRQARFWA